MNIVSFIVVLGFIMWGLSSVIYQWETNPFKKWLPPELKSFLARWALFAPAPGIYEYHLLVRKQSTAGEIGAWQKVNLSNKRRLRDGFWYPEKYNRQLLLGALRHLTLQTNDSDYKKNLGYLHLLSYAKAIPTAPEMGNIQFMVLQTNIYEPETPPNVIIMSEFHKL